jgi:hypothetical protein
VFLLGGTEKGAAMRSMENFIHTENLKLLKKQLETSTDDAQRKVLLRLLAEEEAKGERPTASDEAHVR